MATTVDTLLVRIEADLSDLRRDLKKATTEAKKSSDGIAGAFKKIKVAAVAAVGVAVVRQLGRAGMAAINLAADVEEMTSKSKVVFGSFRDETVAALEAFGNSVGRSTHELEGMASTIQDTFVPMGFARGEAAKLSVEMTKLAVDVASFNNASDVDTMRAFQSALVGNHETVRRFGVIITEVTLSQELMRMGIEKGTKAATEAQKVQARMNLIAAGTSDAQGDAARTADSFTNSSKALRAEFEELVVEIGQELIPAAKVLVGVFREGIDAAEGFLQAIGFLTTTKQDLIEKLHEEEAALKHIQDNYKNLKMDMTNFPKIFDFFRDDIRIIKNIKEIRKQIRLLNGEAAVPVGPDDGLRGGVSNESLIKPADTSLFDKVIKKQANSLKAANLELSGYSTEMVKAIEAAGLFSEMTGDGEVSGLPLDEVDALQEYADRIEEVTNKIKAQKDAQVDAQKILDDYNSSVEDGVQFSQEFGVTNQDLRDTIDDITKAFKEGLIEEELYLEMMAQLKNEIASATPMMETLNSAVQGMSDSISDSFADALMNGKSAMSGLKDAFKGFVKVILKKAIELFVVNQIMNAIFGGFGGYTKLPQAQAFGPRASGGSVNGGQPYMVGERGPELFVPNSSGTVRNAADSRGGGGGTTVINQSISVETGVSQTVRSEMTSILPQFKQETMNAIIDAKRRGGSFGQAMG